MSDSFGRALSDAAVRNAKPKGKPYKLADGGGLFLLVQPNGAKLWRYKYRLNGSEGLDALGAYPEVSLSAARDAHRESRALVNQATHPARARREARQEAIRARLEAELGAWDKAIASWRAKADQGRAPSTIAQRDREIAKHLAPKLRGRLVSTIRRVELAKLLADIEADAPEVAKNLRGYLDGMFEHCIDIGLCEVNPTPPRRTLKRRRQTPRAAIDIADLGAFMRAVEASAAEPATKAAMRLVILTASRKTEVTGAAWSEFDLDAAVWIVPPGRMKARREHWVPLSRQAVAILRGLRRMSNGELVFPHRSKMGEAMSNGTLNAVLRRMGYVEETVHGFRSVFSTRYNGISRLNADVVERCLAHAPQDRVRAVYNRHDYQDERRAMLQDWADYVDSIVVANTQQQKMAA